MKQDITAPAHEAYDVGSWNADQFKSLGSSIVRVWHFHNALKGSILIEVLGHQLHLHPDKD